MLNKQWRSNIRELDRQIGNVTAELNGMKENNDYETKVRKIEDLTKLRKTLTSDDETEVSREVIIEIDNQILKLAKELTNLELDQKYLSKMRQLDNLTKVRTQLMDSKAKGSSNSSVPTIISGLISISSILVILKYEERDVITSKAVNIAMSLFGKGRK